MKLIPRLAPHSNRLVSLVSNEGRTSAKPIAEFMNRIAEEQCDGGSGFEGINLDRRESGPEDGL